MVHNYVEIVFLQLLQIHVPIGLASRIRRPKMIRIAIYGFRRLETPKTAFGMVQMDVFLLNNVLHFKEQSIPVPSLLQLMALVQEQILLNQPVHLTFVAMHHLHIIQMHNAKNGVPLV